MALSFTKTKNSIIRHYYRVYMRSTGTAIAAGDYDTLSHWNTFKALFSEIGHCENKAVKLTCEPADVVELETGEEHYLAYKGSIEIKYLQSTAADYTDLDDMGDEDCDLVLISDTKWIYVHNKRFKNHFFKTGGEIEYTLIKHDQTVASKSAYFSEGLIPLT